MIWAWAGVFVANFVYDLGDVLTMLAVVSAGIATWAVLKADVARLNRQVEALMQMQADLAAIRVKVDAMWKHLFNSPQP